jgi:Ca2+-binding RTX toxin-like protein
VAGSEHPIVRFNWSGVGYSNTFSGSSGNDVFTGFAGADILTGNGGDYVFNFATGHALIGASPGSAVTPATGKLYSGLDVIADFNAGDTLKFTSTTLTANTSAVGTTLTRDADGTVGVGQILAVAGHYAGGSFKVDSGSGTVATLFLFDGSSEAGVQLGVWAAEGIFPMPHFECLRFNAVHECKLHPLPP